MNAQPEDILASATDPEAEELATAVTTIKAGIERLGGDPGAVLTEGMKAAWITVYSNDSAEHERLRKAAKTAGARVTEIDKLIGARNKFSSRKRDENYINQNPSHSALTKDNPSQTRHSSITNPSRRLAELGVKIAADALVEYGDDGPKGRVIDSHAAEILAAALNGVLAWDAQAGVWMIWRSTHWEALTHPAEAKRIVADAVHVATDTVGFRMNYLTGVTQIVCRRHLIAPPDKPVGVVPFANGLLNIETMELTPATPIRALDWCLPHEYGADADCKRIKEWLKSALGDDEETVELLRAWLAALIRGMPLQYFMTLIGPGGSGKGTFTDLAIALVGHLNIATSTLRDLEENRFETAKIFGKRLLVVNEAGRHGGALNMLKSITGGDSIPLERKHVQQTGTFVFEGLVLMATNENIQSTDSTSGLERRRITVRFDKRVSAAERANWESRGGPKAILHREIPGLIRWYLELEPAEIRRRFEHPPQRIYRDNLLGMQAGNSVADWLIENCIPDADAFGQIGLKREVKDAGRTSFENAGIWLYPNYLTWCMESGRTRPTSLMKFRATATDIAKRLGVDAKDGRKGGNGFRGIGGIRLRAESESRFEWETLRAVTDGTGGCDGEKGPKSASSPATDGCDGLERLLPGTFGNNENIADDEVF